VAARGRPKRDAKPQPGRYSRRYDPVEVYLTRCAVGGTLAGKLHRLPRRTVYNACDAVEGDPALLAEADARKKRAREAHETDIAGLLGDAITSLRALIAAGKVAPQHLVAIVAELGSGSWSSGKAGGKTALEVPAILAAPRLDTPHDEAPT